MMISLSKVTTKCVCGREVTLDVNNPSAEEPPIVCSHECFCGEEFSLGVDNEGSETVFTLAPIIKTLAEELPDEPELTAMT